jgi:hypothetical protein
MANESSIRLDTREARERARERLGDLLPDGRQPRAVTYSGSSPCDGWHAAAQVCYQAATQAPNINTAIEWYLQGDAYDTVAQACEETLNTLP